MARNTQDFVFFRLPLYSFLPESHRLDPAWKPQKRTTVFYIGSLQYGKNSRAQCNWQCIPRFSADSQRTLNGFSGGVCQDFARLKLDYCNFFRNLYILSNTYHGAI